MPSVEEATQLKYLCTIKSVRETNQCTNTLIDTDALTNFDVDLSKLDTVVDYVIETIKLTYPTEADLAKIPPHGRFQQFESAGKPRLTTLIASWTQGGCDDWTICKRLIDLFVVSVLVDAGAGNTWKYKEADGTVTDRSEGIAVCSLDMFTSGLFSSDPENKYQVDGHKLANLSETEFAKGFQNSETNEIAGFSGRYNLLKRLGKALLDSEEIFGASARPGGMIDYLKEKKAKSDGKLELDLEDLWSVLIYNLQPIWPTEGRIPVYGEYIGDAWPLQNQINLQLKKQGLTDASKLREGDKEVTFHKLLQWLTYSITRPLSEYGHFNIYNKEYMTGLPEYRNGGLFVDLGLLKLKKEQLAAGLAFSTKVGFAKDIPTYEPHDDVIVEWRSCTICLLDRLLPLVNEKMGITGTKYEMSLPQMIEAGSWTSGRRIAKEFRPNAGPPIELFADGTVF